MAARVSDSAGTHLWLVLMKAHQSLLRHAMRSIEGTGLCFSDFTVLEILLHKGPLPVNTLGEKVSLSSGSATAAIDRLENKGLVRRASDAHDRRTRLVHLTEKGRTLISAAFAQHQADMDAATRGLNSSDKKALTELLKKLGTNAELAYPAAEKGNRNVVETA